MTDRPDRAPPDLSSSCEICSVIPRLNDANPYFVRALGTGYVVLGWNQFYRGYTLFLGKRCVPELHLLTRDERVVFLEEMAIVAEAVFRAFQPRKLNEELLGNGTPHLHWHLFPRHADDPNPGFPVWSNPDFYKESNRRTEIDPAELASMRDRLRAEIDRLTAS